MAFSTIHFFSQVLNRSVSCNVLLPTDQAAYIEKDPKPFKTLYLLHGMTGSCDTWLGAGKLWQIAREYELCIVMPSGENMFYADSDLSGNRFGTFVGKELVEFTRRTFPLSDKREDTFVGGMSMGGFGALCTGLRYPETFGYITAFSAALIKKLILRADDEPGLDYFTRTQYQTMFGLSKIEDFSGSDNDYESLAKRLASSGKVKPQIYMDCGTEDISLYKANAAFKDELRSLGFSVSWDSRPGGHDMNFWNDSFVKAAEFLPVEKLEFAPESETAKRLKKMNDAMTRKMLD